MDAILPGIGATAPVKVALPWETPGVAPKRNTPGNRRPDQGSQAANAPPPANSPRASQPGVGQAIDIVA